MGLLKKVFTRKPKRRRGKTAKISKLNTPYRQRPFRNSKKLHRSRSLPVVPYASRLKDNKSSHKFKLIMATILSLLIIIFSIYGIFFSNYFHVEKFIIEEQGTVIDDYQKMRAILTSVLDQNIILLSEEGLILKIKQNHPELEKIVIRKIFPDTIKIEYEKFPTAANLINIVNGIQKRFLLDSQGFIVEENIEQFDLPYIYLATETPLTVRENFLSTTEKSAKTLTYILNSIYLFEEKFGIKILHADYLPIEREIHLDTEKYFTVMIDMQKNLNRQIEKLKKALPKLDIYNTPLLYIDLRISGTDTEKVIYKTK